MNAGSTAKVGRNFGSRMIEIRLKNMTVEQIESILNKLGYVTRCKMFKLKKKWLLFCCIFVIQLSQNKF